MSKLLSVLAVAGNKDAAILQAADDVRANASMMIAHGNARNILDTLQALREDGAVTKGGDVAKSRKGAILASLLAAHDAAQSARLTFQGMYAEHKGKPTVAMLETAGRMASGIADAFEASVKDATTPKAKAKKAPKDQAEDEAKYEAKVSGPVPVNGKGEYDAESLLRVIRAEKRRIAVRDKIIAELRAELAALALVPTEKPVKRQSRKAA